MNLDIFYTWVRFIWPFWAVQYAVLLFIGPPSSMTIWAAIVIPFNLLVFVFAMLAHTLGD